MSSETSGGGSIASEDEQLAELHQATRRLMDATDPAEIKTIAVDAATEILGFPFSVFWEADSEDGELRALAISEPLERHVETPEEPGREMVHERGSWLWDHYAAGETRRVVADGDETASDAPLHGGITVPLDEYGMLTAGTNETKEPTSREQRVADILGKNVLSALRRAEHERRLRDQRDDLDLLNQIVRHDLKNDLQYVLGRTGVLREESDGNATYVDQIEERVLSAADLLETAGTLATVVQQTEWDTTPVDVGTVLSSVVADNQSRFEHADITLADDRSGTRVRAGDLLDSVFDNVVQNAVEHNDSAHPTVTVEVTESADTVRVSVLDDGPGIDDTEGGSVFERGEKGADSSGSGVGLYLVRTLVEGYGGDVWMENRDEGGAVVTIELRKAD